MERWDCSLVPRSSQGSSQSPTIKAIKVLDEGQRTPKFCVWEFGGWPVVDRSKETTLDQYYDPNSLFGCMMFVWIARTECKTQTDMLPDTDEHRAHVIAAIPCSFSSGVWWVKALLSNARQWKSHFQRQLWEREKKTKANCLSFELSCWVRRYTDLVRSE